MLHDWCVWNSQPICWSMWTVQMWVICSRGMWKRGCKQQTFDVTIVLSDFQAWKQVITWEIVRAASVFSLAVLEGMPSVGFSSFLKCACIRASPTCIRRKKISWERKLRHFHNFQTTAQMHVAGRFHNCEPQKPWVVDLYPHTMNTFSQQEYNHPESAGNVFCS